MSPSCPVCDAPAGRYGQTLAGGAQIRFCPECGLRYTVPMPDSEVLHRFYAGYHDPRAAPQVVAANAADHLAFLAGQGWHPGMPTIDLGCGTGAFVTAAGAACHGVDPWARPAERQHSALHELPGLAWGCLTLWGVLEHLADPVGTLAPAVALLQPLGLMALTTVDAEGTIPFHYKPPEHLTYWTRTALTRLGRRLGLSLVSSEPYVMQQVGDVYLDRLLARTPPGLRTRIRADLPELVQVPTNEVRALFRKEGQP